MIEQSPRAIGYVRVSTTEQAESGLGLSDQEERIGAYAVATDLELVGIVREEGVSGSVPIADRIGGAAVLLELGRRKVRHVVALKLDRLFRDAADCLTQTRAWDRASVALHLVDMGGQTINTGSAMGRMFLTMAAGFAELERNLIAERTAAAMAVKRRRGEYTGGGVPYGYRLGDGGKLLPDVAEQECSQLAVDLQGDGMSYRDVASELASRGMLARGRRKWNAIQIWRIVQRGRAIQGGGSE